MPVSVTAIITCYNYGRFVEESIRSVLNQDWSGCSREIIVVDNESTDDTRQRVEKFVPEVRYIYQKNQGQGGAFNTAFRHSSGEIICFQDADDIWYPRKIVRVLEEFARHPEAGIVQHPLDVMDISGRVIRRASALTQADLRLEDLLEGRAQMIGAPGLSIRRSVFEKISPVPTDVPYCADEYVSKHALFFAPARTVPEALGCLRVHGDNFYQKIDWKPENIEKYLMIREHWDRHLDRRLKEQGLRLSPRIERLSLLERRKKEILLCSWRDQKAEGLSVWFRLKNENPASLFLAFKMASLLIAMISPNLYLNLQAGYEKLRWLPRLRRALLRENASLK